MKDTVNPVAQLMVLLNLMASVDSIDELGLSTGAVGLVGTLEDLSLKVKAMKISELPDNFFEQVNLSCESVAMMSLGAELSWDRVRSYAELALKSIEFSSEDEAT